MDRNVNQQETSFRPEPERCGNSSMATASMVLGIAGIVTSCACCIGLVLSGLALILGLMTRTERTMERNARIGVITGSVGLVLSLLFLILWVMISISGF